MAVYALTSPDLYFGYFDLSGDCNALAGHIMLNDLDVTTFGSGGWHQRIAGLVDTALDIEGFTNLGNTNSENYLFSQIGVSNQVVTIGETDGSQGSPALLFRTLQCGHEQPIKVGDAAGFKVPLKGSSVMARGTMIWGKSTQTATTSSGTYVSLGAMATTQYLYGTQHIFSFAGTSIVTTIKSATNASGLGATTRLTFTSQSTASSEFAARVAGPVTDTFWGASTTIVGATASITFAVAMAIQ